MDRKGGSAWWEFSRPYPVWWRRVLDSSTHGSRNRLLAALPAADRRLLAPFLEAIELEARQIIETPQAPISHVYFVESGLISVVGTTAPNHRIEVGMVGYEGMTGLSIVMGDDQSANETLVQSAGVALRISCRALRKVMNRSRNLTAVLLRYGHVFMIQGSQTALANGRGRLDERLARWLLMWHDRIQDNDLIITHEFLALLLGVRRPGVTVALHDLEGDGLIRCTRNHVQILDREGLLRVANGFYGVPEAEYDRSIGLEQRSATGNR
jgi:CRP-like cAMP-binding protein